MLKFLSQQIPQIKGSLLIISGASIGHVPTLTCDEFIKLNSFKRIAFFKTKFIEPSVGYLPQTIEGGSLGLPIQLYQKGDTLILQFRSYCRFARKKDLAKQIIEEFKKYSVEEFVLLSSLPYNIRPDLEIGSVEKNVYFKSKGVVRGIQLVENKEARLLSILHLIDDQDQESNLMKSGGLANAFYQQSSNIIIFFIFSQDKQDPNLVSYYQKYLNKLLKRKELC